MTFGGRTRLTAGSAGFDSPKRRFQIGYKSGKGALDRPLSGDQNVVRS
jgi:hypothetical protein